MKFSAETLIDVYGAGQELPTTEQWETLVNGDMSLPLTVVNFFILKEKADTSLTDSKEMTGMEAFRKVAPKRLVTKLKTISWHVAL